MSCDKLPLTSSAPDQWWVYSKNVALWRPSSPVLLLQDKLQIQDKQGELEQQYQIRFEEV
jgi:hypothetical protein